MLGPGITGKITKPWEPDYRFGRHLPWNRPPKATEQKADPQPQQSTTPASPKAQPQPEVAKSTPQKVDAFEKQNNPAAAKTGA